MVAVRGAYKNDTNITASIVLPMGGSFPDGP